MYKRFLSILLALLLICQGGTVSAANEMSPMQLIEFSPMKSFQQMINHGEMLTDFTKTLGRGHDPSLVDYSHFYMLKTIPENEHLTSINVAENTFKFVYNTFIYSYTTHFIKGSQSYNSQKSYMQKRATQTEVIDGHTVYYRTQNQGTDVIGSYNWEQDNRIFALIVNNPTDNMNYFEYCSVEPINLIWPEGTLNRTETVRSVPYKPSETLTQLKKGSTIKIIDETKYYYFIETGFVTGYVPKTSITVK